MSEQENIIIENTYFEQVNSSVFQGLIKKNVLDAVKPRYWLSKAFDKIVRESKHYFKVKESLLEKYSFKYEEDGEEKDKEGKTIREWKKGDSIQLPDGGMRLTDGRAFMKELKELQEIKVDIGIFRIQFDDPPDVTIEENMLLIPLLEEKIEFTKGEKPDGG